MPRFVIQKHLTRKSFHFDLMLESGDKLLTWSFRNPLKKCKEKLISQPLKPLLDHRKKYLTYEGKISGGRGSVKIWDNGTYRPIIWQKNIKVFSLKGRKIKGGFFILSLLPHLQLRLVPLIHFQ
ncbi:MAG: DNA polymerase ligase N-terminal domain-containing protein [Planctomycetota bacterium]|nr:DNA polymerase ligase N-terminal domain-containing protein [Planctomycetota bacterium]MDI6786942.1 DNA polymerase ligase N-terminal domain-containing protein [Planctomycetota bacterium]